MKTKFTPPVPEEELYMIPFGRYAQDMTVGAVRYAMGRRTYVVSVTVNWTIPFLPHCTDATLNRMLDGFRLHEGEIASSDDCDIEDWQRLYAAIMEEKRERAAHALQEKEPFTILFDRDTQDILISYVRCAMARRDIDKAEMAVNYTISLLPHCEDRVLRVLMNDFNFYDPQISDSDECNMEDWQRLKRAIVEERVRRADNGTEK